MLGFEYYILLTMIYFSTLTETIRLYSIIIYFELKCLEKITDVTDSEFVRF